jgi:hypothetical protein
MQSQWNTITRPSLSKTGHADEPSRRGIEPECASTMAGLKTMHSVRKRIRLGKHVPTKSYSILSLPEYRRDGQAEQDE